MNGIYEALGPEGFATYAFDFDTNSMSRADGPSRGLLIPGFVDIHVHGGFGIDFMSATAGEMAQMLRAYAEQGYEYLLPTTVTATPEVVLRALSVLPDDPMVAGFHLEGPFISPKFPGAQPPSAIAEPPVGPSDWDAILDDPRLRVVTVAPEIPNALALIRRLTERGVVVSMGHTNATYAEVRLACECGASHTTHTFNAMRPLHHREAGTVGYALGDDDLYTELIYDRLHVCKEAAEIFFKCKPIEKVLAVSDGTRAIGMPEGERLVMWGLNCIVGHKQVRLEDGTLAGSGITLLDAFRNLYEDFGPEAAIRSCSLNPRVSLGLPAPKKFIHMNEQLEILGIIEV